MNNTATYHRMWRWHFYAGLFVLPFILILSASGAIYLFKPQIDQWEEREFLSLSSESAVSADAQLEAALNANPGSRFNHYRLPRKAGDAAMIQITHENGEIAEVYVSPDGEVIGSLDPTHRISTVIAEFHGSLMLGKWGDRLVELAASWTIVMILTGLYLWWPRPFRAAGTLWPRTSLRGRALFKDIHRVTGFWISGLVLVMLASGLPWAGTWGSAFKWARTELGLVQGVQEWKIGAGSGNGTHGAHHGGHEQMDAVFPPARPSGLPISTFVRKANAEGMAFPVLVLPPNSPQRFGPPTGDAWTVKSEAQNRSLNRTVTYDPVTAEETGRSGFADKHVIDQAVGYGIAWHEGQLFGLANQIVGLLTALALIGISVLGVIMWWRRKPQGKIAAPPKARGKSKPAIALSITILMILLPLFGLSVIGLLAAERIVTALSPNRWQPNRKKRPFGARS
ncbi:MAG: PepSY domain-containing protein [Sphingomonadales bacterium]|nr:MAG: PepSY domain-containing protein [Sphingomonadales bacterium]